MDNDGELISRNQCIDLKYSFYFPDVDILFAAALTVFEDAGMIEVCVALSNNSQTQREFTVELSTMDTGYAQGKTGMIKCEVNQVIPGHRG